MEVFISGLKINYIVLGEGRPILVLHGWGSRADKWQNVGHRVSCNGYKVVIPDLPGFGKSQEPPEPWGLDEYCNFIEKFITAISATSELTRFYLVGHSFGGAVAVKYAIKNPEKIKKLFLVAAACIRKKTLKKSILTKISKFFKNLFSPLLFPFSPFGPFYNLFKRAFYKFIIKRSDYLNFSGVMKESYLKVIAEDLSDKLSLIKTKTIIIWGDRDDVTLVEDAYFINKKIEDSKLIIILDGEHDLEQKSPEILADKILEELSKE